MPGPFWYDDDDVYCEICNLAFWDCECQDAPKTERIGAWDWLNQQFGMARLEKGMAFQEKTFTNLPAEVIIGRTHALVMENNPEYRRFCVCPPGANEQVYHSAKQNERLDLQARPTLPIERTWG